MAHPSDPALLALLALHEDLLSTLGIQQGAEAGVPAEPVR